MSHSALGLIWLKADFLPMMLVVPDPSTTPADTPPHTHTPPPRPSPSPLQLNAQIRVFRDICVNAPRALMCHRGRPSVTAPSGGGPPSRVSRYPPPPHPHTPPTPSRCRQGHIQGLSLIRITPLIWIKILEAPPLTAFNHFDGPP